MAVLRYGMGFKHKSRGFLCMALFASGTWVALLGDKKAICRGGGPRAQGQLSKPLLNNEKESRGGLGF